MGINNLAFYRDKKRLSQEDLAKMVGCKREYISMLETGKILNPTKHTMEKIAKGIGESVEDIFFAPTVCFKQQKGEGR